ncbi:transporter substrate-binding domain-containing protein [Shimia sp. R11_0]|uniref:transporter substrate-binding domain-containing protein n=1 Tax=Shimia sp. R11_0 TaxID=2821096 RepID=UPI001ADB60FC|nr:transporter substrate-binding domain-containing protein [Shimia sp. R11_0]MBO9479574.1 transporter substrate-binding domain-containing protein [Shimia sp. R11_0]
MIRMILCAMAVCGMAWSWAAPAGAETPDTALQSLLNGARAQLPAACEDQEADRLIRILCSGQMRTGVRGHYPLFATRNADRTDRIGYDTDVARAIAMRLGVKPEWVHVRAATRISSLAEDSVDVVIATMGHNTRRDSQARFIRPHYYRSETIVVGPREIDVSAMADLAGRRICTTIGNYANSHLVSQGLRLMLFEDAGRLPKALDEKVCSLVAHDDSFLASYLAEPSFGVRFEPKFGFDPVPWGMAVAQSGTDDLARVLQLISQIMHRDGEFLDLARKHGIFTQFLEEQHALWKSPTCLTVAALDDATCILPALDATPPPTAFADKVEAAQDWMRTCFGVAPALPMLSSQPAFDLFVAGIVNSIVLVIGALLATLFFALGIGFLAALPNRLARFLSWCMVTILQSSPVILTLVVAAAAASAIFTYSATVALGSAIVALGLMNGCNAGQAIGEAADSLRQDGHHGTGFSLSLYRAAVVRSLSQLLSFLVNAAKGTPVASFTGAPELLSALTDITSFAAGRATTYSLVLVFYVAVVFCVVWACEAIRKHVVSQTQEKRP